MRVLAVDIGGTKVDIGVVQDGMIIERERFLNNPSSDIAKLISSYGSDKKVDAVGIGVAGQVNYETGLVIFAPNVVLENYPLGELVGKDLQVPVFVENDANVFALGVWRYEFQSKPATLLAMTLGTGIGGGFIYNGNVMRSAQGASLEIGHMVVEAGGPNCTCGSQGCLEAFAGGWALEKWYNERTREKITGAQIHERAKAGDQEALYLYQRMGYYLGVGAASLANILNPEIIVLGATVSSTYPLWKDIYSLEFKKRALPPLKDTPTMVSTLKDAALLGAAALAEQGVIR
jgi:glucokinase